LVPSTLIESSISIKLILIRMIKKSNIIFLKYHDYLL